MKKTIVLLLSLILLFSFVSCNGSTNSPSDSGSSNKIPSVEPDKNVPPTSEFESASSYDCANILLAINAITKEEPNSFDLNQEINFKYTAKDGAKINEKILTGSITKSNKNAYKSQEHSNTFNGTLMIADDKYEFINYKYTYNGQTEPIVTGTIKKGGIAIDLKKINEDSELNELVNNLGFYLYFDMQLVSAEGKQYAFLDNSNFVGGISSTLSVSDNYLVNDTIVNFSKVSIGDSKNHTLTAEYKKLTNYSTGEKTLKIKYISFDNHYFTAETVLADNDLANLIKEIF